MDLAQNTRKAAEEIKALRQVVSLIKHDLARPTPLAATINPFESQPQPRPVAPAEQLVQAKEALENKLAVCERVQKTLEQELVGLKLAHAQELQALNQRLNHALD